MAIIKQLIAAIVWIFQDLKEDFLFLFGLITGKRKASLNKEELAKFNLVNMLKASWTWYLLIFAALFCGMFLQAQQESNLCNEFIQEELLPSVYEHYGITPPIQDRWIVENLTLILPTD